MLFVYKRDFSVVLINMRHYKYLNYVSGFNNKTNQQLMVFTVFYIKIGQILYRLPLVYDLCQYIFLFFSNVPTP